MATHVLHTFPFGVPSGDGRTIAELFVAESPQRLPVFAMANDERGIGDRVLVGTTERLRIVAVDDADETWLLVDATLHRALDDIEGATDAPWWPAGELDCEQHDITTVVDGDDVRMWLRGKLRGVMLVQSIRNWPRARIELIEPVDLSA